MQSYAFFLNQVLILFFLFLGSPTMGVIALSLFSKFAFIMENEIAKLNNNLVILYKIIMCFCCNVNKP